MSTINNHPSFVYSQPEEYHYSHDSVFLAYRVYEILKTNEFKYDFALDLCSGCGIVGLDLLFQLFKTGMALPQKIDFLEIQNVYADHFIKNTDSLRFYIQNLPAIKLHLLNYTELQKAEFKNNYDLIICNPPYFRAEHSKLSDSDFKNKCKFFIESDFNNLILSIENSLNSNGRAYVLIKSLNQHGIIIENEMLKIAPNLKIKKLEPVRNTDFYELTKKQ